MAQVLKEESRQAIIRSAKKEFLEKGYEKASMRSIAKKAGMTVGNLYRYYKSKEDIIVNIVSETFNDIEGILQNVSFEALPQEPRVFNMKTSTGELKDLMDELAVRFIDIYTESPMEFNILMKNERMAKRIIHWFEQAFENLLAQRYMTVFDYEKKDILAHAYATSIFSGMKEIFKEKDTEKDTLLTILKAYFRSFILTVDNYSANE